MSDLTVGNVADRARLWVRRWLGVKEINLQDIYDALLDENGKMIRSQELQARIDALETAYATDPRRAEIAKEKAEAPTVIGGFTPRSKRIRNWEAERKAEPKK